MTYYQKGYLHYILLLASVLMIWQITFYPINKNASYLLLAALLFIVFSILSSYKLSLELTDDELIFRAGIGIIKKVIPFSQIESASLDSTRFWSGIGIRFIGKGWLYNIKLGKTVEIKYKNKTMVTQFGFDQAEEIVNEINQRLHKS